MSPMLQSLPSPRQIRDELEQMVFADLHGPVAGEAEEIDASRDAIRSAINSAIRHGILGYEGSAIWREE